MSISRFGIKCAMHDGLVSHAKLFSWLLCKDFQVVEFLRACSFVDGGSRAHFLYMYLSGKKTSRFYLPFQGFEGFIGT